MSYRLLSLIDPAPDGFTHTPVLEQRDVRRWPFALLSENVASAEAALEPFGSGLVGIIVTSGDVYRWQQLAPLLYHFTVPACCGGQLAQLLCSHLEILDNWHRATMDNAGQQLNLFRTIEDNNRHQLEFAVIKENLLNELSERKRVESEHRSTRNHLTATLNAMPDLLFEVGPDGRIIDYYSPRTELLAVPPDAFLNKRMADVLSPDVAAVCEAAILEAQAHGSSVGKQYELMLPHDRLWFELSVSTKTMVAGEEPRFIMLARDITKRKRAELELQKKNADMEQFIYTVSHDLRSPLVTVKAFLGYLEGDMESGDQDRIEQDLQFIHGATDRMKMLLDELLELSRVDRVEPNMVAVSFKDVVDEVLDIMAGVFNEQKVEILHYDDTNVMMFGDRPRFCQIWQNLIENAVKYSYEQESPRVEVGIRDVGSEPVFYVKDNGIGIDPDYHKKIFNLFEKLDPGSSGVGIGLAMVRRIVEKFGGRIWVESEGKGTGSCFCFTLPGVVMAGEGADSVRIDLNETRT